MSVLTPPKHRDEGIQVIFAEIFASTTRLFYLCYG